ncbi:HET-domain-containing protein, partial [Dichomitus squalens LYAD-421 SS1]
MRLLDVDTGSFLYFTERDKTPPYAILSHTWDSAGEQTYQEVKDIQSSYLSDNTAKIRRACEAARNEGVRYMWIDSACIDKTSSSELSESINSMYIWYRDAVVCYAFLADVPVDEDPQSPRSRFRQSRWFRRGWTLQELIAPRNVVFFSMEWIVFGTKSSLATVVEEITGIERSVLTHRKTLDDVGVARRMSWAARRETTRVEDRAYSLFGIFGINLPTLYGEGEQAFRRLQEEILRRIPDQSLFAWGDISLAPL